MSIRDALEPGGSPVEWRRSIACAVEPSADFGASGGGVMALAGAQPTVFPAPSYEAVIHAILAREKATGAPADVATSPRRRRAGAGPSPGPTSAATPPEQTASNSRASRHPGVPPPSSEGATRSSPVRSNGTVAAVRSLPHRLDRASLTRRAGEGPAGGGSPAGARTTAVFRPGPRRSRILPTPSDKGSAVESAVEKVAERLGNASAARLLEALRSVPRPGPPAPGTTLGRLHLGERRAMGAAGDSSPIGRTERPGGSNESIQTHTGRQAASDADRPGEPRHTAPGEQFAVPPRPIDPSGDIPSDASPLEDHDATFVRHVSSHQELPPVPRRERSSAPAGLFEPDIGRPKATSIADGDDLERRMKQILDEAARRHGIEV